MKYVDADITVFISLFPLLHRDFIRYSENQTHLGLSQIKALGRHISRYGV